MKRSHLPYATYFRPQFDPLEDETAFDDGGRKKRLRFGRKSDQWVFTDVAPSTNGEQEAQHVGDSKSTLSDSVEVTDNMLPLTEASDHTKNSQHITNPADEASVNTAEGALSLVSDEALCGDSKPESPNAQLTADSRVSSPDESIPRNTAHDPVDTHATEFDPSPTGLHEGIIRPDLRKDDYTERRTPAILPTDEEDSPESNSEVGCKNSSIDLRSIRNSEEVLPIASKRPYLSELSEPHSEGTESDSQGAMTEPEMSAETEDESDDDVGDDVGAELDPDDEFSEEGLHDLQHGQNIYPESSEEYEMEYDLRDTDPSGNESQDLSNMRSDAVDKLVGSGSEKASSEYPHNEGLGSMIEVGSSKANEVDESGNLVRETERQDNDTKDSRVADFRAQPIHSIGHQSLGERSLSSSTGKDIRESNNLGTDSVLNAHDTSVKDNFHVNQPDTSATTDEVFPSEVENHNLGPCDENHEASADNEQSNIELSYKATAAQQSPSMGLVELNRNEKDHGLAEEPNDRPETEVALDNECSDGRLDFIGEDRDTDLIPGPRSIYKPTNKPMMFPKKSVTVPVQQGMNVEEIAPGELVSDIIGENGINASHDIEVHQSEHVVQKVTVSGNLFNVLKLDNARLDKNKISEEEDHLRSSQGLSTTADRENKDASVRVSPIQSYIDIVDLGSGEEEDEDDDHPGIPLISPNPARDHTTDDFIISGRSEGIMESRDFANSPITKSVSPDIKQGQLHNGPLAREVLVDIVCEKEVRSEVIAITKFTTTSSAESPVRDDPGVTEDTSVDNQVLTSRLPEVEVRSQSPSAAMKVEIQGNSDVDPLKRQLLTPSATQISTLTSEPTLFSSQHTQEDRSLLTPSLTQSTSIPPMPPATPKHRESSATPELPAASGYPATTKYSPTPEHATPLERTATTELPATPENRAPPEHHMVPEQSVPPELAITPEQPAPATLPMTPEQPAPLEPPAVPQSSHTATLVDKLRAMKSLSVQTARARRSSTGLNADSPWFAQKKISQMSHVSDSENGDRKEEESGIESQASDNRSLASHEDRDEHGEVEFEAYANPHLPALQKTASPTTLPNPQLSTPITGLRTSFSYFAPLSNLSSHFDTPIDTLAIVIFSTPVTHAKTGPRDYTQTLFITDPSSSSPPNPITNAQIFRPNSPPFPSLTQGDPILLRNFKVQSFQKRLGLLSTNSSAWAVFRRGADVQVRGPPMEFGPEERAFARGLWDWWRSVGAEIMALPAVRDEMDDDHHDATAVEERELENPRSAERKRSGKRRRRGRPSLGEGVLRHELRDGVSYTDGGGKGPVHELRDGTTYSDDVES